MSDVRTALRTLMIFEAFGAETEPMSLSQIAARLDIPTSSCLQLIRTLVANGYLYGVGRRQNYYPTRRLFDVAERIVRHDPLIDRIRRHIEDIRDRTGESVALGTLQGDRVIYLASADSRHTLRVTITVGTVRPAHSTATGKALLGSLDASRRARVLGQLDYTAFTSRTLAGPAALQADLEAAERRGYYTTFGEGAAGLSGLAVPVIVDDETYAIGVSGPSERIEPAERELAAILIGAVREKQLEFQRGPNQARIRTAAASE